MMAAKDTQFQVSIMNTSSPLVAGPEMDMSGEQSHMVPGFRAYDRSTVKICSRCVYDDTVPSINFDENGVCNYCHLHDQMVAEYPTNEEGQRLLQAMIDQI